MNSVSTDLVTLLVPVFQSFGVPSAIAVILGWTLRKLCLWGKKFWTEKAWPYIEKAIQAYLSRQATMEECTKQLTEKTIEIQQQVLTILLEMKKDFPGLCKNRDQSQH